MTTFFLLCSDLGVQQKSGRVNRSLCSKIVLPLASSFSLPTFSWLGCFDADATSGLYQLSQVRLHQRAWGLGRVAEACVGCKEGAFMSIGGLNLDRLGLGGGQEWWNRPLLYPNALSACPDRHCAFQICTSYTASLDPSPIGMDGDLLRIRGNISP